MQIADGRFEILGNLLDPETIASGRRIRELARLRRVHGRGNWRKRKGVAKVQDQAVAGMSKRNEQKKRLALCIDNAGCPVSLEVNKLYLALPDEAAERAGMVRVIDESGEDYLFPADCFVLLPQDALSLLRVPAYARRKVLKALEPA